MFNNVYLGIDLIALGGLSDGVTPNDSGDGDTGANNLQNFPVLVASTGGVDGSLNSRPNTTYRIEYFGSTSCDPTGNGEGQFFLGTVDVVTDANGNATLPFQATGSALFVTATATSSTTNDTSEFSNCVQPTAITREWISNAGGNWEDPTRWSGGVVPQPGEVVIITGQGDFTVTVQSADVSLNTLSSDKRIHMAGGRLTIENIALFDGGLTMAGGVLTGPGILALGGASSWTGGTFEGAGSADRFGRRTPGGEHAGGQPATREAAAEPRDDQLEYRRIDSQRTQHHQSPERRAGVPHQPHAQRGRRRRRAVHQCRDIDQDGAARSDHDHRGSGDGLLQLWRDPASARHDERFHRVESAGGIGRIAGARAGAGIRSTGRHRVRRDRLPLAEPDPSRPFTEPVASTPRTTRALAWR